jgi:hypothetical protein
VELFCYRVEDGHQCSLFGSSRDDAVRGARGFSERREDWESGLVFARCFVTRAKDPKEATIRPRNTSGFGPFRPPGGDIRGWWQAHPLDRFSHPRTNIMDIRYNHGSLIHCLRASHSRDAPDLLAIGGEHSIAVLQIVSYFRCRISQRCAPIHWIS